MGEARGGVVASMMCRPLVLETACRARILTSGEMVSIRRAWAKVAGVLIEDPTILATRYTVKDIHEAIPELNYPQPRGFERLVSMSRKLLPAQREFAEHLAIVIGTIARYSDDTAPVDAAFRAAIDIRVPVYFEDDHTGVGTCAICGKRGAFGRCP